MHSTRWFLIAGLIVLAPASGAAQPVETEIAGVTAEVAELRNAGGVVRLAIEYMNAGDKTLESDTFSPERITLVDVKSRKKYFPIKDANGDYLAGPMFDRMGAGSVRLSFPPKQPSHLWAYFEAVPAGTVVTVEVPTGFPFDDVKVTDGPGKAFNARAARTTPTGGTATLVSARRADETLTVRLRLAPEKGTAPELTGSYFEFQYVSAFDPAAKRVYQMLKDTEGYWQGQPNSVKSVGRGSFIMDWDKTTLVSLSFPAPPDTVKSVDLLLPYFLPFEGIPIEGTGGATESGVSASGKALGLEGAIKELNATVTETEIRIDLSADVLFDFDKATLKKDAEPSLKHVATVLQANPTARISIEGHTDAKGTDTYNQTLSEQRAASVKEWLVAAGASAANITTRGWGKAKPLAPNTKADGADDPEGRAKNRRVQIIVRK